MWIRMRILWLRVTAFSRYIAAERQVEAEVQRSDRRSRVVPFAAMTSLRLAFERLRPFMGHPGRIGGVFGHRTVGSGGRYRFFREECDRPPRRRSRPNLLVAGF